MQQFIEQEINRAKMLIQPERSKLSLGEAEVILPSAELGALAAIGVQSNDPDVVATIYLFESQASHDAAVEILSAHVPQEGTYILSSSNGPLLCFGYSYIDGTHGEPIDAKYALSDLMQAFAGEEE